ncbi:prepilin peptidase-dependent protein [Klebsiella sp. BIGb0407]|uniref:prepilin peptidase-dependent protein n=1 Tax=Klebsiella sp. BIGb0407 TaxID=2940603 RepID=UPI0021676280|nr:prepilin peptidase-dependent protein [Klebsiella sp. BIGb0407]MCS3430951.1 prepilin peptidase dependent protein B [Klebsiella sp. BIGb0407]
MRLSQQGFTLIEVLVALALSGVLLLGSMRLFPTLQRSILRDYQSACVRESVWQLAYRIGKHLQRAGYCRGVCKTPALQIEQGGSRVMIQWQAPDRQSSTDGEYVQTGYRLHQGTLQILKGTKEDTGELWEKISDPELMMLTHFSVTQLLRKASPPLLEINLTARQKQTSSLIKVRHIVRGENL